MPFGDGKELVFANAGRLRHGDVLIPLVLGVGIERYAQDQQLLVAVLQRQVHEDRVRQIDDLDEGAWAVAYRAEKVTLIGTSSNFYRTASVSVEKPG